MIFTFQLIAALTPTPLFGFVENVGTLLAWGGLAAAPLVLHLLSRRKYREVPWAAMQYLLAAVKKNSRRMQIEQLILLLLRTVAVILIVLAAAKPFLENSGLTAGSRHRTHKIFVLDASYSMAYKPADQSRFELARQLAAQIVEQGTQGDGYSLILMGTPPRVIVGPPAFESRDFLEELANVRLAHSGADLSATLAAVEQVIDAARSEHPRLSAREVYFLTDVGRNTWAPDLSGAPADDLRARTQRLADGARLVVLDLGQPTWENMAVTQLALSDASSATAHDATFEAELRNFGNAAVERQLVEWYVDGRRAGQETVDIGPGARVTISLAHHFDAPGDHAVEVRLGSDFLEVDNHRWLSLRVKDRLRVLAVGSGQADGYLPPADYLALALEPNRDLPQGSAISCEVVGESSLADVELASYDCLFLADVGQFTASEATLVATYLRHGGNVIWFLGPQVQIDSYNRRLTDRSADGTHALPAVLLDLAPKGQYMLNPLDYKHPLLAAFRGRADNTLLATLVTQYVKAQVVPESRARVVIAYDNGDPAIVEEPIGRGRSILVTTSADRAWSIMPLIGSLNELVYEMLAWTVTPVSPDQNVLVGQPIGGALHGQGPTGIVQLRTPAGEQQQLRLTVDGDYSGWSYGDTLLSGIYRAELPQPWNRAIDVAVNVDTVESDLTAADVPPLFEHLTQWQDLALSTTNPIVRRQVFQVYLLVAALLVLLLETVLAWRFGTRGA